MNETIYLKKLEQREIKPTAIRLLILKTMMQRIHPIYPILLYQKGFR